MMIVNQLISAFKLYYLTSTEKGSEGKKDEWDAMACMWGLVCFCLSCEPQKWIKFTLKFRLNVTFVKPVQRMLNTRQQWMQLMSFEYAHSSFRHFGPAQLPPYCEDVWLCRVSWPSDRISSLFNVLYSMSRLMISNISSSSL